MNHFLSQPPPCLKSLLGEKFSHPRPAAVFYNLLKNFFRVGGAEPYGLCACVLHLRVGIGERGRGLLWILASFLCKIFTHLCGCFSAVARVAERLEVLGIDKQRPVSSMGCDVVNIGCTSSFAGKCTMTAEWLAQELIRSKMVSKDRQLVPPVPGCSFLAATTLVFRLVCVTVPIPGQDTAANMSAGSQGPNCHGLSPPGIQKAPEPSHRFGGSAQARWLRLSGLIFTMDSRRQFLHQTGIFLPAVSGRSRKTF